MTQPLPDASVPLQRMRQVYLALLLALVAASILVWFLLPGSRDLIVAEGELVENLSASFAVVSAIVGLLAVVFRLRGAIRWLHLPICLLATLSFLDEIDWGQHLLYQEKLLVCGYEVDGVHDIFALLAKLVRDQAPAAVKVVFVAALCAASGIAFLKRRTYMPWIMAQVRRYPAFDYVRYAVIVIFVAQVLDLDVFGGGVWQAVEESLEAGGNLALVFAGVAMHASGREDTCANTRL